MICEASQLISRSRPVFLRRDLNVVDLGPELQCLLKVVRDPCQKITLLLLESKSVRVIVPESCFLKENTYF